MTSPDVTQWRLAIGYAKAQRRPERNRWPDEPEEHDEDPERDYRERYG